MQHLLIDVGNTFVKVGVEQEGKIRFLGSFVTAEVDVEAHILDLMKVNNVNADDVEWVALSSVVPTDNHHFMSFAYNNNLPLIEVGDSLWANKRIGLNQKGRKLGADLICQLFYASQKINKNSIVVSLGTVTAITVLKDSVFQGATFFPGVSSAIKNVSQDAALINVYKLDKIPKELLGNNTQDCLVIGAVRGQVYQINSFVRDLKKKYNSKEVILVGGNYKYLKDFLDFEHIFEPSLTLKGLHEYTSCTPTTKEILDDVFETDKEWKLEKIEKGRTNVNYKFSHEGNDYVFRHSPNKTYKQLQEEARIFWKLKNEDLTCKLKTLSPKDKYMITHYLHHKERNIDDNYIDMACESIKQLSNQEWKATNKLNPAERMDRYNRIRFKNNIPLTKFAEEVFNDVKKLMYKYTKLDANTHSDLSDENILISNNKAYLIDWEYIGLCDRHYDPAVFCVRNNLNKEQMKRVIKNLSLDENDFNNFLFISSALGMFWTFTKENWDEEWEKYHQLQVDRVKHYKNNII